MKKKYIVRLTPSQREHLEKIASDYATPMQMKKRAYILLDSDENAHSWKDVQISKVYEVSIPTIERVRKRFVMNGLDDTLKHKSFKRKKKKQTT